MTRASEGERNLALPPDARVFLGRLTHLDPEALVRLKPAGPARTALWARLPWRVLVTREVALPTPGDVTVGAAALLTGRSQQRRDAEWRWPLPPQPGEVVEEVPAQRLREVAVAAAGTLREVTETGLGGQAVGARVLREALLDHVAVVVEIDAATPERPGAGKVSVDVPQRLVQAVIRMGFLGRPADDEPPIRVRRYGRWVGLAARYGTGWLPPPAGPLSVRPGSLRVTSNPEG